MQQPEKERARWRRSMLGAVAIFMAVVVAILFLLHRAAEERFDLPVDVFVCGSPVDLAAVTPGIAPTGCIAVPSGIQLSMTDPDSEANAYTDGFFGFRKVPADSSESTLIAEGAIASSTMSMVSIDENGVSDTYTLASEINTEGQPEWMTPFQLSSNLKRLSIYIVTSPDSPPIIA